MDEFFRLNLGGFFQSFDTTLNVGSTNGTPGTGFNLENDLGLGHSNSFRADGYWRWSRHFRLDFGYRGWNRTATHTLTKQIDFGDHTYDIGATVDFRNRANIFDVYLGWSPVYTPQFEFGVMLGISAEDLKYTIDKQTVVNGNVQTSDNEERKVFAPIPAIGAYISATIMPRLFVHGDVRGFPSITIGDYKGSLVDGRVGLDYFFSEHWGLGATYNYVKLTFAHKVTRIYELSSRYSGPMVYLGVAF